jgi:hypothetical protein
VEKLDAGEMSGWSALLPHPMCARRVRAGSVGCEAVEKVASVEGICGCDGQSAQAKWKRLERGPGVWRLLEQQNRATA